MDSVQQNYEKLNGIVSALSGDLDKFNAKRNKSAGQRVRSGLLNCKKVCDLMRKQLNEDIKSIPVASRKKAEPADIDDE